MLLTRDTLPKTITDIAALDDLLCRPSQALIDDLGKVDGDIMVLGVAGKMGPTLAGLAKAALPDRRVIGVARFSEPGVKDWLAARAASRPSIATCWTKPRSARLPQIAEHHLHGRAQVRRRRRSGADLGDERARAGAGGAGLSELAHRRVLDRLRLSFRARRRQRFGRKASAPDPPGEYAQSCVGRERMFEYFSHQFKTPGRLFRLNYAIDMRYGVLHDIATKVLTSTPIDVSLGMSISSGRATPPRRRCAASPIATHRPRPSMSAARRSSRCAISQHNSASCSEKTPVIVGKEEPTAWLTDTSQAVKLVGLPIVDTAQLISWTADWVARSMPSLGKPTKTRCAMGDIDHLAIEPAWRRRRGRRVRAVDRSALESERGRLAVLSREKASYSAFATAAAA